MAHARNKIADDNGRYRIFESSVLPYYSISVKNQTIHQAKLVVDDQYFTGGTKWCTHRIILHDGDCTICTNDSWAKTIKTLRKCGTPIDE